jgi:SAM-dependent methyltransferase
MSRTLRQAFAHERDPATFDRSIAGLTLRYLDGHGVEVAGRRWLDVGTGGGSVARALREAGAEVVALDVADRRTERREVPFVVGDAVRLPFADGSFDGVLSSNVLEHVPDPRRMLEELLRVCRPEGTVYLAWTNWLSPFGGHDWSPFHYLGPRLGPRAFRAVTGRSPRLVPGQRLFPVHVGPTLRWLRSQAVEILDVAPRYWPALRGLARLPGLREVLLWNCAVLMRPAPPEDGSGGRA